MNYTEYLNQIISLFGIPTLIAFFFTENVKGNIKTKFDKKLEIIKNQNAKEIEDVKKEHSKEIAQFQTELNYLKSKENFKFTKLHEKRFVILSKTYKYLSKLLELLHLYSTSVNQHINNSSINEADEIENSFRDIYSKSSQYISQNMLFFDDEIEKLLVDYMMCCGKFFNKYDQFKYIQKYNIEDNLGLKFKIDSEYQKLEKLILPLKKEIEKEFRKFLGE